MENLKAPTHLQVSSKKESAIEGDQSFFKESPFVGTFPDPLCKLNLKETSEFVKSFPMNPKESRAHRRLEAPSTPGRPVFSFSAGIPPRKSIPSKWDDAEKWLISRSCHESPAHAIKPSDPPRPSKQKADVFGEKLSPPEENEKPHTLLEISSEVFLKDKFTANEDPNPIFPNFKFITLKESATETEGEGEVHRRDIGTEMTPLGSSTTSRCHTPIKTSSPARHNTPASRSGPLGPSTTMGIDLSELQDCHFAKLKLSAQYDSMFSNWSSREEEEEEVSKSLRHTEMVAGRKSIAESRASAWEDEERTKSCIRYQREEARIQAWMNLQSAKAEAQSRKLEVKIEKMRSNLEEKLNKRMTIAHRRAEEWRAAAQLQHSQQMQKASEQKAQKLRNHLYDHASCLCFPCNNHIL